MRPESHQEKEQNVSRILGVRMDPPNGSKALGIERTRATRSGVGGAGGSSAGGGGETGQGLPRSQAVQGASGEARGA